MMNIQHEGGVDPGAWQDFAVLIVPGWRNSGPTHWQSHWERRYPAFERVQQTDWDTPDILDWVARLDRAVRAASRPVLLVAHSLGCVTVARWAAHAPAANLVKGALLVAPADVERSSAPSAIAGFAPISRRPLPFAATVVASTDDPYCRLERAEAFAQNWGTRLQVARGAGHINADSGLQDWEDGLRLLGDVATRARIASLDVV